MLPKGLLFYEVANYLKSSNLDLSSLQYAKKNGLGYKILAGKHKQYHLLKAIAESIYQKYQSFSRAQISQALSELVNSPKVKVI